MSETDLLIAAVLLAALAFVFSVLAAWQAERAADGRFDPRDLQPLKDAVEHTDKIVRDEIARMRNEAEDRGKNLRGEVREQITGFGTAVQAGMAEGHKSVDARLEGFTKTQSDAAERLRFEVGKSVAAFGEGLKLDIGSLSATVDARIAQFVEALKEQQQAFQTGTGGKLDAMAMRVNDLARANAEAQEKLRISVEEQLSKLRTENDQKLEQMRATVDEKLQGTLEKRLGESFKQVSERLTAVHEGLGQMSTLAAGVGDLKKVLSNVKDRGGWAEMQLGALLEHMLAPEQYEANVRIDPAAQQVVEFAVRLPGVEAGRPVYLPIDAKFPKEEYERLIAAGEAGDAAGASGAAASLERIVEGEARKIAEKYIRPPYSTDFAILYLPTEGLFAEAMRRPGLIARIQANCRVMVAGPSTLAALLTSLQMGFRTLAIQKRSSEVWQVLGEAKAEFERYGQVWDKLSKQLTTAQNTVDEVKTRTRAVTRKLSQVQTLDDPGTETPLLTIAEASDEEEVA